MDPRERLRRLAFNQLPAHIQAPGGSSTWLEPSLDAKTVALVRLGALVAMGSAAVPSYGALTDQALSAGASVEEIVDVLVGILPVAGPVRVVAGAPRLAWALGFDTDDLPEEWPLRL